MEHVFGRLLKTSDVLRSHVQHYDRMHEDHADRSYRFLNDMVDKAINEERHRKNQEALIVSASGGSRTKPSVPGVTHQGNARPKTHADHDRTLASGDVTKGKCKGKAKARAEATQTPVLGRTPRDPHEDFQTEPSRTKTPLKERCVALTTWRMCTFP